MIEFWKLGVLFSADWGYSNKRAECRAANLAQKEYPMNLSISAFRRNLVIGMVVLFLLTQALIFYPGLASDPGQPEWWTVLLNLLIISIPLTLLYGSLYMVVMAWREHALHGQVESHLAKFIHWAARKLKVQLVCSA